MLAEKIKQRRARLAVVGSGYVGLPTAALFADVGFDVTAVDVKSKIVESVNGGVICTKEPGLQELVLHNVKAGRLRAVLSSEALLNQDVVIVSVQTPIDKKKKPNLSFLFEAVANLGKAMKKGMLAAISSTVPPGTLQEKIKPLLESLSGLEADKEFYLAYVPERIAPGRALREFVESPRLVGGIGPNSTRIASELFKTVCKQVIETDAAIAEVAKLAENTYRDVNIAFANQLALICEHCGADVTEVIKLANTHPRVNIHMPGPGAGGPCLPKDPYLLLNSSLLKNHNIITISRRTNDNMPKYIVKSIVQALKRTSKNVETSKVAILGTAYKGNVDDARQSPAEPIINGLKRLNAQTVAYDPICNESFGAKRANSLYEAVTGADCFVIVTDHMAFKDLNLQEIKTLMNERPVIIDGRRIVNPREAEGLGFIYYGIGYGVMR